MLLFANKGLGEGQILTPAAESLLVDVGRIVESEESSGWFSDRGALDAIYGDVLESVCRVLPRDRKAARRKLQLRVARLGDSERLFREAGEELSSRTKEARRAERELKALSRAMEGAADDCPYWAPPGAGFRGRQADRDRFTLSLETGGLIQLRQTEGSWTMGGGGYARILPGYGFQSKVTVLLGPEFGGGAMLRPNTEPTEFVINYFPAVPAVLRFHQLGTQFEFETAPVGLFQADDSSLSYGLRVGWRVWLQGAARSRGASLGRIGSGV